MCKQWVIVYLQKDMLTIFTLLAVQNQADGSVKVVAFGDKANLVSFIEKLREGPRMAIVKDVKVWWQDRDTAYTQFVII